MGEQHQTAPWKTLEERVKVEPDIPLNLVSLQALIEALVAKGVVTPEELSRFELEHRKKLHEQHQREQPSNDSGRRTVNYHYYSISTQSSRSSSSSRLRWLKRKMSKRRWTRRLGTLLFGWKWKKISKEKKNNVPLQD